MEKEIIIHVGAPKTGTTFLQKAVLPNIKDVCIIGSSINIDNPVNTLVNLQYKNPLYINKDVIEQQISEYFNKIDFKKIFYSDEVLLFKYNMQNILKSFFPKAKIIIIFRKQDDWLESAFNKSVRKGDVYTIEKFLNLKGDQLSDFDTEKEFFQRGFFWNANELDWGKYIQAYIDLFGKDNVLALPYELMKENQTEFLEKIYEFADLAPYYPETGNYVNRKYSNFSLKLAQIYNQFFAGFIKLSFLKKCLKGIYCFETKEFVWDKLIFSKIPFMYKQQINEKYRKIIMDFYRESNKELEKITGFDLSQYGYY